MTDAAITFAVRVGGAVLAFAMQALLARTMLTDGYGGYVLIWTWLVAIGGVASLGLSETGIRFLPRYQMQGRAAHIAGFWRYGLATVLAVSIAVAALGVVVSRFMPSDGDLSLILLFIALGLPFFAMDRYLEGIARGLGWFRLTSVPVYLLRPLLIIAAIMLLQASGQEVSLLAAGAILIGSMGIVTVGVALAMAARLRRVTGAHADKSATSIRKALWLKASLPLLLVAGFEDLLTYSDVLLIGMLLPNESAAIYFAAARALALANFAYYAIFFVAARRFSLASGSEDRGEMQRLMTRTTLVTVVATFVSVAATLLVGPWLLAIFGPAFVAGYPVMIILGAGLIGRSLAGQANEFLIVSGGQKEALAINVGALVANATLTLLLVPIFGLEGAALATAAVMLLRAFALIVVVRQRFGLRVLI